MLLVDIFGPFWIFLQVEFWRLEASTIKLRSGGYQLGEQGMLLMLYRSRITGSIVDLCIRLMDWCCRVAVVYYFLLVVSIWHCTGTYCQSFSWIVGEYLSVRILQFILENTVYFLPKFHLIIIIEHHKFGFCWILHFLQWLPFVGHYVFAIYFHRPQIINRQLVIDKLHDLFPKFLPMCFGILLIIHQRCRSLLPTIMVTSYVYIYFTESRYWFTNLGS